MIPIQKTLVYIVKSGSVIFLVALVLMKDIKQTVYQYLECDLHLYFLFQIH